MLSIRDGSDRQSRTTSDKLIKDAFERSDYAAEKHLLGRTLPKEKVTTPQRKLMGQGLRRQPWLKALKKLAKRCRNAFCRNALEQEMGTWEDHNSELLRVCANVRLIENAVVSGDVMAVYALSENRFLRHSEEAFNALRDDSHTAYEPSR